METLTFNNDSDVFIEKYAPQYINEIIGASYVTEKLKNWLLSYNQNARKNRFRNRSVKYMKKIKKKKVKTKNDSTDSITSITRRSKKKSKTKNANECSTLMLTGNNGSGRTAIAKAVLNDLGYEIRTVNFQKLGNIKMYRDFVESLLSGDSVYDTIQGSTNKKIAILIDNLESISANIEKNIINAIIEINSEKWAKPIVFIASRKHNKFINSVKSVSYNIYVNEPEPNDLMTLLLKIGEAEEMKMENKYVAVDIIKHSQGDYRRLIVTLQELMRLYGNKVITRKKLKKYLEYTDNRDIDRTIFEDAGKLFSKYDSINSVLRTFEGDKINTPLMMHQNVYAGISDFYKKGNNQVELSMDVSNSIANGDIIDNYIYSDQNWDLQGVYGLYSCVFPSYELTQNINTNAALNHCKNQPIYDKDVWPFFPKDLNRTSTKKINYKNVKMSNKCFKNMSIMDYVFSVKVVKSLLADGRIDECRDLLKGYDVYFHDIMYMLKIDKINGSKKDIPKSIEKKIKEMVGERPENMKVRKAQKKRKVKNKTQKK